MLIAERLLMLDRRLDGQPWAGARDDVVRNRWMAASLVVELAVLGRLSMVGPHIHAPEDLPVHYMLLNDAQAIIRKRPGNAVETIEAVHRAMPRIAQDLLDSMVRRGLLIAETRRRMLIFSDHTYPVQSTSSYSESVQLLESAAHEVGLTDLWKLGFLLLADGMDIARFVLPELALALDGKLSRFEAFVSSSRASSDASALRARLIFALTKLGT
jgi:Golgi phosphoprotein 3 (GPP34)